MSEDSIIDKNLNYSQEVYEITADSEDDEFSSNSSKHDHNSNAWNLDSNVDMDVSDSFIPAISVPTASKDDENALNGSSECHEIYFDQQSPDMESTRAVADALLTLNESFEKEMELHIINFSSPRSEPSAFCGSQTEHYVSDAISASEIELAPCTLIVSHESQMEQYVPDAVISTSAVCLAPYSSSVSIENQFDRIPHASFATALGSALSAPNVLHESHIEQHISNAISTLATDLASYVSGISLESQMGYHIPHANSTSSMGFVPNDSKVSQERQIAQYISNADSALAFSMPCLSYEPMEQYISNASSTSIVSFAQSTPELSHEGHVGQHISNQHSASIFSIALPRPSSDNVKLIEQCIPSVGSTPSIVLNSNSFDGLYSNNERQMNPVVTFTNALAQVSPMMNNVANQRQHKSKKNGTRLFVEMIYHQLMGISNEEEREFVQFDLYSRLMQYKLPNMYQNRSSLNMYQLGQHSMGQPGNSNTSLCQPGSNPDMCQSGMCQPGNNSNMVQTCSNLNMDRPGSVLNMGQHGNISNMGQPRNNNLCQSRSYSDMCLSGSNPSQTVRVHSTILENQSGSTRAETAVNLSAANAKSFLDDLNAIEFGSS